MISEESNNEKILVQWQTCVEMANSISQRRDTMNNIFVTLNLAIITAVSVVWNMKAILIAVAGIAISILWMHLIKNYKELNAVKFRIINNIEEKLPCQPFNDEWKELKSNKKYKEATKLERVLPILFITLYILSIITIIVLKMIR